MTERAILLEKTIYQRTDSPKGLRIWTDGLVQRTSDSNPHPDPDARLDKDHELAWVDSQRLSAEQIDSLKEAIERSNYFDLEPVMLINYCKEDPGTAIWKVNLEGRTWRVVVFDPRPRRSTALDSLDSFLKTLLESQRV